MYFKKLLQILLLIVLADVISGAYTVALKPSKCAAVRCRFPDCMDGEVAVTPPGECCPICQLDCRLALCPQVNCDQGYTPIVPKGQCCPTCQLDCSAVQCLACVGLLAVTTSDSCCPTCV